MPRRGKGPLRIATEDFAKTFLFDEILKHIKTGILFSIKRIYFGILQNVFIFAGLQRQATFVDDIVDDLTVEDSIWFIVFLPFLAVGGITWTIFGSIFAPIGVIMQYHLNRIFEPQRIDLATGLATILKSPTRKNFILQDLEDAGYNTQRIDIMLESMTQRFSANELIVLLNKEVIGEEFFDAHLAQQGWRTEDITSWKKLRYQIPPITDLLRMAVRDAFSADIVSRFGLLDQFPSSVVPFAEKQGLQREWIERYWSAHWELPSVGQGFEMLHRLRKGTNNPEFSSSDLDNLLKAKDIPPFFRERLKAISYAPLTRVDVRRMFRLKVLSKPEVESAYLDDGYNETNAKRLADFVEKDAMTPERDLTRSAYERAYRNGLISRDDAKASLITIGYDDNEADFWLNLIDFVISADSAEDEIKEISEEYLIGDIDDNELLARLGSIDLPGTSIEAIQNKLIRTRKKSTPLPTKADIKAFLSNEIINEAKARDMLSKLGYSAEYTDMYMDLFTNGEK